MRALDVGVITRENRILQYLSCQVVRLSALCREDVRDLKNVFLCSKHFLDEDIKTSFSILQSDGSYLEVPGKPNLHKRAVPSLLPGYPPHLFSSSDTKQPRFDRSLREQRMIDTAIDKSIIHSAISPITLLYSRLFNAYLFQTLNKCQSCLSFSQKI